MTDMSAAAAHGSTDAQGSNEPAPEARPHAGAGPPLETPYPGAGPPPETPYPDASPPLETPYPGASPVPEAPDPASAPSYQGASPVDTGGTGIEVRHSDPWADLTDLSVDDAVAPPRTAERPDAARPEAGRPGETGPRRRLAGPVPAPRDQPDAALRDHVSVPTDTDALSAPHARARDLAETGDLTSARTLLEETLSAGELSLGRDHPRLAPLMVDLATIARSLGNLTEAQNQLRRAYGIVVAAGGPEHPTALSIEGRLAAVTYRLGEPTEPYDWHLADVGGRILGPDHPAIRGALRRLAAARDATPPMADEQAYQAQHADAEPGYAPPYVTTYAPTEGTPGVYRRDEPSTEVERAPSQDVEVWRDPRRRRRRGHGGGLALVASLGATALVAGAVVAFQLFGPTPASDPGAPPGSTAPAPPSAAPPPTTPSRAPGGLRLRDDGGSVTLTWSDPSGGQVPFIVTGGRVGATPAPLDSVASGRTSSTIYGLNVRFDYCFTVAAVWSPDEIASSVRTCTDRL
jgi:hypothetical protein